MLERDYFRRGAAEFIGTFALIFVGAGSVAFARTLTDIALAHGLVIAAFVSAFGFISGGHFNPAITLGFLVTRRIAAPLAVWYWIVQFGAAAVASLMLKWVLTSDLESQSHLGAPALGGGIHSGAAVVVEAILTFFLVIVVFATAVDAKGAFDKIAGLAIGLTIVFGVLMAGPLTGGALNPARAFGPELVSGYWTNAWVWYVGPLAGGALAAILYEVLYLSERGSGDVAPAVAEPSDELPDDAEPATEAGN